MKFKPRGEGLLIMGGVFTKIVKIVPLRVDGTAPAKTGKSPRVPFKIKEYKGFYTKNRPVKWRGFSHSWSYVFNKWLKQLFVERFDALQKNHRGTYTMLPVFF